MYKIVNKKKLFATVLLDIVGYLAFFPILLFKRQKRIEPDSVKSILIIRTAYLGDVVMTLPVLKPLKERFPNSKITFLTSTAAREVLINNPYVDEILTFNPFWFYPSERKKYVEFIRSLKRRSFDLVIEARGDLRELLLLVLPLKARYKVSFTFGGGGFILSHRVPFTGVKHKLEYHLDIARYLDCGVNEEIEWGVYLTEEEKKGVEKILDDNKIGKPFICVHPGARHPLRRWFPERFASLCDRIAKELNIPIVFLGAKDEKDVIDEVISKMEYVPRNLAGLLSLREMSGILSKSQLFICNNSGPMHIAASLKVPTVVIHGPSKSYWDAPYGNLSRIMERPFPCRDSCDENSCHHSNYAECLKAITVEEVFTAVKDILREMKKGK